MSTSLSQTEIIEAIRDNLILDASHPTCAPNGDYAAVQALAKSSNASTIAHVIDMAFQMGAKYGFQIVQHSASMRLDEAGFKADAQVNLVKDREPGGGDSE